MFITNAAIASQQYYLKKLNIWRIIDQNSIKKQGSDGRTHMQTPFIFIAAVL